MHAADWTDECPQRRGRDESAGGPPPSGYVCNKCHQPGHWIRQCPLILAEEDSRPPPPGYQCNKCKAFDHYIRNCPLIAAERAAGGSAASMGRPPPPNYVCAKCHQSGHWIQHCELVKGPPPGYLCKVCSIPGHYIKDCPIVIRENAERGIGGIGGMRDPSLPQRKPPADYICGHCQAKAEQSVATESEARSAFLGGAFVL